MLLLRSLLRLCCAGCASAAGWYVSWVAPCVGGCGALGSAGYGALLGFVVPRALAALVVVLAASCGGAAFLEGGWPRVVAEATAAAAWTNPQPRGLLLCLRPLPRCPWTTAVEAAGLAVCDRQWWPPRPSLRALRWSARIACWLVPLRAHLVVHCGLSKPSISGKCVPTLQRANSGEPRIWLLGDCPRVMVSILQSFELTERSLICDCRELLCIPADVPERKVVT